jgi:glycine dehydrogenase
MAQTKLPPLGFDPDNLPREKTRHYIPVDDDDIKAMLEKVGVKGFHDLYQHLPPKVRFDKAPELPDELSYTSVQSAIFEISKKNNPATSFIGDGLPDFKVHEIVSFVCGLRNLTTSYTPYQPERSQGTLLTQWIYQCLLATLTGFEAINSSLYDRSTALHEAICCATRLKRKSNTAILPASLHPADLEVAKTLFRQTDTKIIITPIDLQTGSTCADSIRQEAKHLGDSLAAIAFPQVNNLGLLEDVDALTDLAVELGVKSIAIIDPMLIAGGGLKPPSVFGKEGADIIVGEAQHLAIGPNFGGPGLGLFGIRYNGQNRNGIRQTPGRYVGKSIDAEGRDCRVMVLSTREQHIRKDKATSNICSNQAFLATIAGAAVLSRGEIGMRTSCEAAINTAHKTIAQLITLPGVELAYSDKPFVNESTLRLPCSAQALIQEACSEGLHIGVSVGDRLPESKDNLLKISFSDKTDTEACNRLVAFFEVRFGPATGLVSLPVIPEHLLRQGPAGLPDLPENEIRDYYQSLANLNVSPEKTCYPLGSCTMKYNPYINDWAASLKGFTDIHPQAPVEDVQGSLEILFQTQEWFKTITGLAAVTTQPVAGAQGELVGLKMFQAYHEANGDNARDAVLIPKSAHGTNFATAATAGFHVGKDGDRPTGIILLEADPTGQIDMDDLEAKIKLHGKHICGILVTNPNTGGVFETKFKEIADKIHTVGGLVYMDGANMNAIASWADLGAMGVDAVHNNLHKTWTIPHGGGGPGDAIVAVSEKLVDFLPGLQICEEEGVFKSVRPEKSIGSFHRHWGNFAHKVRCYTYLLRLGKEGVPRMSAMAVLASRYLYEQLKTSFPMLPPGANKEPRMHEFILTLSEEDFDRIEAAGIPRTQIIAQIGKLFLDFGFHSPTVAFPEAFGLMIEPTESYTRPELDRFAEAVRAIGQIARENPHVLQKAPYFTPIDRVDEVAANRNPVVSEPLLELPPINPNRLEPEILQAMSIEEIQKRLTAMG